MNIQRANSKTAFHTTGVMQTDSDRKDDIGLQKAKMGPIQRIDVLLFCICCFQITHSNQLLSLRRMIEMSSPRYKQQYGKSLLIKEINMPHADITNLCLFDISTITFAKNTNSQNSRNKQNSAVLSLYIT
jgi:hypothetical protein